MPDTRGLPAAIWDEERARTLSARGGQLYPAADADDVWGWTDDPEEAGGIIDGDADDVAGVDPSTTTGGATVIALDDVIVFAAE